MTLLVSGSRTITDRAFIFAVLDKIERPSRIVVGGAPGVDTIAEEWAVKNCVPFTRCEAAWEYLEAPGAVVVTRKDGSKYNKKAGHDRNVRMSLLADQLLAFSENGSKGTDDMIRIMRKLGKPVAVVYYGGVK